MARHRVEIVGVNTANISVLSNEEMLELFKQLKQGNLQAKEKLINGNLKLIFLIPVNSLGLFTPFSFE